MSQMSAPGKHTSEMEPGEEFETIEYVVTPEMVNYFLIGINDRHPWYVEDSPFGGTVTPPIMIKMASIRLNVKHLWGDFIGARFTKPAGLNTVSDLEYFAPVKVGEKVTVKGKCVDNYMKRGRRYVSDECEIYGEDGRLCARCVNTSLIGYQKEGE
ncbi:MaoC family dehydratase [Chloroflexota bacterium]